MAAAVSSLASRSPDVAIMTGSTTSGTASRSPSAVADRSNDLDRAEHPRFDRARSEIVEHRVDLRADQLRAHGSHDATPHRVLRGDRRDRRRAEHTMTRKGAEITLDPRAATGIRAGDGERYVHRTTETRCCRAACRARRASDANRFLKVWKFGESVVSLRAAMAGSG